MKNLKMDKKNKKKIYRLKKFSITINYFFEKYKNFLLK